MPVAKNPSRSAIALEALALALRIHEGGDEHPERVGREPGGQQGEHQPAERLAQHHFHRAFLAGDLAAPSQGEAQGQHADQDGHDALGAEADAGHDVECRGGGAGGALEVGVGHEGRAGGWASGSVGYMRGVR